MSLRLSTPLICIAVAMLAAASLRSCRAGDDATRERKITAAAAVAAVLKPQAAAALARSTKSTARATASAADYEVQRARVVIDTVAHTIAIAGGNEDPLPPVALSLLQSADTTIPQLRVALVDARAGWAIDRERADSIESAFTLSEQRAAGPWCGRKCGITIGVVGTVATVVVITKYVLPLLKPHEAAGAASRFTLRASIPTP